MSSMGRRLFNILSAISLLPCFAIAAIWVRSYWVQDAFNWERKGHQQLYRISMIRSVRGTLKYESGEQNYHAWFPNSGYFVYFDGIHGITSQPVGRYSPPPSLKLNAWLLNVETSNQFLSASVSHFAMALLALVFPLLWLIAGRRQQTTSESIKCGRCGYDLRATPDHCPECGTACLQVSR